MTRCIGAEMAQHGSLSPGQATAGALGTPSRTGGVDVPSGVVYAGIGPGSGVYRRAHCQPELWSAGAIGKGRATCATPELRWRTVVTLLPGRRLWDEVRTRTRGRRDPQRRRVHGRASMGRIAACLGLRSAGCLHVLGDDFEGVSEFVGWAELDDLGAGVEGRRVAGTYVVRVASLECLFAVS